MDFTPFRQKNLPYCLILLVGLAALPAPAAAQDFWSFQPEMTLEAGGDLVRLKDPRFEAVTASGWQLKAGLGFSALGGHWALSLGGYLQGQNASRVGAVFYRSFSGRGLLAQTEIRFLSSSFYKLGLTGAAGGGFFEYDNTDQVFFQPFAEAGFKGMVSLGGRFWLSAALNGGYHLNPDLEYQYRGSLLAGVQYDF